MGICNAGLGRYWMKSGVKKCWALLGLLCLSYNLGKISMMLITDVVMGDDGDDLINGHANIEPG